MCVADEPSLRTQMDAGATEPSDPGATISSSSGAVERIPIGSTNRSITKRPRGITNRSITKQEVTNTSKENEICREEVRDVCSKEPKETARVRIYEYRWGCIGIMDPASTQFPSACQRPAICDTLMEAVMPPQTKGACKWCQKSFSSSTPAGFFPIVGQHLSNNHRCIKRRGGLTATPQEAIPQSSDAADIIRLNDAKCRARDFLIGSEFDPEFLDAWDRRLRESQSVDSTEDVMTQLVEVIRRLRAMGYLPESPHPPGMRPPPSYVVYTRPAKISPQQTCLRKLPSSYKCVVHTPATT